MSTDIRAKTAAVIGGGPAGLATAIHLRRAGFAVTVVERTAYDVDRVGEHLPPNALRRLAALAPNGSVLEAGHLAAPAVLSSWSDAVLRGKSYFHTLSGQGLNLTRPAFDARLAFWAEADGVRVERNARLVSIASATDDSPGWELTIQRDGGAIRLQAGFAVDASGRGAVLAKRLGATTHRIDRHIGITAKLTPAVPVSGANGLVMIESLPSGWWYAASLASGEIVATVTTDSDLLQDAGNASAYWSEQLKASLHTARLLADCPRPERVLVRDAGCCRLDPIAGNGWLAVGEAAAAFDPLSSQGIDKALRHGEAAADALVRDQAGEVHALAAYAEKVHIEFNEHLDIKTAYYRDENRWSDQPYWQRRHPHPGMETIVIDPRMPVEADTPSAAVTHPVLGDLRPLLAFAAKPLPLHRLAANYRQSLAEPPNDRTLILTLQQLLDRGYLRPAGALAMTGARHQAFKGATT